MGEISVTRLIIILVPVLLTITIGFLIGKILRKTDISLGSRLAIYLFFPVMIINNFRDHPFNGKEIARFALLYLLIQVFVFLYVLIRHRIAKFPRKDLDNRLLITAFTNCGSYGLPVISAAFGPLGLAIAIQYLILFNLWVSTVGVYLSSGEKLDFKGSLKQIFKLPLLYGFFFGIFYGYIFQHFPLITTSVYIKTFDSVVQSLNAAALPFVAIVVGLELSRISLRGRVVPILPICFDKLIIIPLFTVCLLLLFPILGSGLIAKVMIIQTAMPTAYNTMLLTKELKGNFQKAASTVFLTTILSPITVSIFLILVEKFF